MVSDLRSEKAVAPIYVATVTRNPYPCTGLQKAQQDLANPGIGILSGPDADQIDARYDGVHLTREGIALTSALWFESLIQKK